MADDDGKPTDAGQDAAAGGGAAPAPDAFAAFRAEFPAASPRLPCDNADQRRLMTAEDGRRVFGEDDPPSKKLDGPPRRKEQCAEFCHLWVVAKVDAAYGEEHCDFAKLLRSGVLKHTNLTGGEDAHSGGEIYFLTDGSVFVNFDSGRYGAHRQGEAAAVAQAIADVGFKVGMIPYDEDLGNPPKIVSAGDEVQWLERQG